MIRKMTAMGSPKTDFSHRKKIYSGYLYKQGSMFSKKFQKRYFILYEGRKLAYYTSDLSLKEQKGEIDLTEASSIDFNDSLKPTEKDCYQHVFEIKCKDRLYVLAAPNIKSANEWIDYIRSSVFGTKIHSGWLTKQGDLIKSWKRRYFVLTDTKLLRYFEDFEQLKFKGVINVQHITSISIGDPVEPYWNFMIHLQTSKRLWYLNADSEDKRQEWLTMLREGKKTINYDQNASLFVDLNTNVADHAGVNCKPNERIKFILNLYHKWCLANDQLKQAPDNDNDNDLKAQDIVRKPSGFKSSNSNKSKGIYEIINNDLKDYTNVHLLNDFNYILTKYGDPNRREKFLEIFKYILGNRKKKPSIPPEQSLMLMRNLRDRSFYSTYSLAKKLLYNDNDNDSAEINTQNLLDRISSYLLYSYNTLKLDATEWSKIKDYDETDKLCTSRQMLIDKRLWINKSKDIYRINDRNKKFMIDVNQNNDKTIVNKDDKDNDDDKDDGGDDDNVFQLPLDYNRLDVSYKQDKDNDIEYYQFGFTGFEYWDDCKDNDFYVNSVYNNLKEEVITNKLCLISINQWNELYENATNLSETSKASEFLSFDGLGDNVDTSLLVEKYGIYEYTPIKINHICSILLYCNFYDMQQALLSTYRKNNNNENINNWKSRHGNYYNWSKHLVECCFVFGKLITEKDVFYYSINSDKIDFGRALRVSFCIPTSMTRDLFVSQTYFEFDKKYDNNCDVGMLLSVSNQIRTQSFYIDCAWCSDFVAEEEVLVFSLYPSSLCRIQSMVHVGFNIKRNEMIFNNYQHYMSAIADLDKMINGNKSSDQIGRNSKIALQAMIKYKFYGEQDDDKDDDNVKEVHLSANSISVVDAKSNDKPVIKPDNKSNSMKDKPVTTNTATAKDDQKTDPTPQPQPQTQPVPKPDDKDKTKPVKDDQKDDKKDNNSDLDARKTKRPSVPKMPAPKVRPKGSLKKSDAQLQKEKEMAAGPTQMVFKLKAKRKKKVPDYVKAMFYEYCQSITQIKIDFSRMVSLKNGFRAWRDIFMNDDDTWLKLDILVQLFINLTLIKVFYIPQAFTKNTIKQLIVFLNSDVVDKRELDIEIYKEDNQQNAFDMDKDINQGANIDDISLKVALNKYLKKKSKTGNNFKWFSRLNEDGDIPFIQIIRPSKAIERNKDLSSILNEKQVNILMNVLNKELIKQNNIPRTWYLNVIFRASKDGFDSTSFHKTCDGISHSVSIIKSSAGNIFGCYTSKAFGRTGKHVNDKYAFLVLLKSNNNDNNIPKIYNIKSGHEQYGLFLASNGGPGFGRGDIKILSQANKSSRNCCNSKSFTFNMKPINELSGGKGSYFKVVDYEVFKVAFY